MATLPSISHDMAISKNITPNVLTTDLGDGYAQRATDGINNMREEWSISWTNRPAADITTLEDFFMARKGSESFDWTAPRASSSKKYICTDWSRTYSHNDNDSLDASFIEVFEY